MSKASKATETDETPEQTPDAPAAPVDTEQTPTAEDEAQEKGPGTLAVEAIWAVLEDGKPHFLRELTAAAPALTADLVKHLMSTYREEGRVQYVYDERVARRTGSRGERKYRAPMVTLEDLAWQALSNALEDQVPPCAGKAMFTADRPTADEQGACAFICAACPLLALCGTYAATAKPSVGFWAGRQHGRKPRTKTTSTTADRTASGTHPHE